MNKNKLNPEESKIYGLISSCVKGSTAAFSEIVKIYRKYIYTISFRIMADEDDARDVVQETFIKVWKHIAEYNERAKFTTWIYKIAVNLCYDKLKARKRKARVFMRETDLQYENLVDTDYSGEKNYSNRELAELIEKISECLPEKQRIIFSMRDLNGFSIEEVAAITGLSVSAVKTNLVYARRSIKVKLEKQYDLKDWK